MSATLVEPSSVPPARRLLGTLLRSREMAVLTVLLLLVALTTASSSSFLFSSGGWRDLLLTPSILLVQGEDGAARA